MDEGNQTFLYDNKVLLYGFPKIFAALEMFQLVSSNVFFTKWRSVSARASLSVRCLGSD